MLILDTKVTSDLVSRHKALRMGKNFVAFVSSFAALCIFRQPKRTLFHSVFVFNNKKLYTSVFILHSLFKKYDSRKQVEVNQIFVELSIGNPRSRRYRIGNQLRRGLDITLPVA